MEIQNDPKLNAYAGLDKQGHNKNMSTTQNNKKRADRVDLSGQIPNADKSDSDIRPDKIARVKANIAAGRYEDPEVIDSIVDRIINQFGL